MQQQINLVWPYDQAAASQLQITTEDNVAYGHREDDYTMLLLLI